METTQSNDRPAGTPNPGHFRALDRLQEAIAYSNLHDGYEPVDTYDRVELVKVLTDVASFYATDPVATTAGLWVTTARPITGSSIMVEAVRSFYPWHRVNRVDVLIVTPPAELDPENAF